MSLPALWIRHSSFHLSVYLFSSTSWFVCLVTLSGKSTAQPSSWTCDKIRLFHTETDKHWCPGDGVSPWHNHTLHYKHKSSTHHHYPQTKSLIEEAKWPFLLTWGHLWKQLRKIIFKNVLKLQVLSWTGNRKNNLSKHWRDVKSLKSYSYMTNGTNCTS